MPTQREKFNRTAAAGTIPAHSIPEFPKLPEVLKRSARTEEEKKSIEKYESDIQEFFKKLVIGGGL
jgi:hypothetical protein